MEEGYDVLMIDRRDVAQGSSSATTSMLQYEIDVQLKDLSEMIGEEAAVTCYKAGITAIKKMGELVEKTCIECGFESKTSLFVAHNKSAEKDLKLEFDIRNKHNLGVTWLDAKEIKAQYGLDCKGGILSETAASVDAYQFAHELIQLNVKRGMKVYDQTEVKEFNLEDVAPHLVSEEGFKVYFDKAIFCTGFESTQMIKENIADLFYTYATVSEQDIKIPEKLKETLVWNTEEPYLYMRTTDDNRLLIGGEDATTNVSFFQQNKKEKKAKTLKKKLEKLVPGIDFTEDFSWAGTFGTTKDGLPYIGASPEHSNALFVLGFGGNGITFSVQAMDIIVDFLKGRPNELSNYYKFGR
jgi:glycine/D-amino acid oxidase-like deaminating enzyme